jgi:hypothetical protein
MHTVCVLNSTGKCMVSMVDERRQRRLASVRRTVAVTNGGGVLDIKRIVYGGTSIFSTIVRSMERGMDGVGREGVDTLGVTVRSAVLR